ncbi:MAG: hypothetical protein KDC93_11160 [Cyclobacteriaceae bacterium]|nr:hypothetical protein [Cyclobacteriaceae bacterium]
MKHLLIVVCLWFGVISASSQRLAFSTGLGLGSEIQKNARPGIRAVLHFSGYYNLNTALSLGFEVSNSGNISLYPTGSKFDETGTILTIDPSGMHANTLLAKGRYSWHEKDLQLFAELGLGVNTFFYKYPTFDIERVDHRDLAIQPEVGFVMERFQLSLCYFHGGSTPQFNNFDQGYEVRLRSVSISALYIKGGFRLEALRKK